MTLKVILSNARLDLVLADCSVALRKLKDASVDSVVTDPPYELGFMGKSWDASGIAYSVDLWREVLRVLKPGGYLLAFGGTRTYHRMACAIEDAGFEVRDSLMWLYGTGFSKSLNIGEGRGTALKPAHEPIVMARKPLIGTVAANVAAHGTGALNVDGCRIEGEPRDPGTKNPNASAGSGASLTGSDGARQIAYGAKIASGEISGRWPANVLLDESAAAELDAQSGFSKSATGTVEAKRGSDAAWKERGGSYIPGREVEWQGRGDSGGASRFFAVFPHSVEVPVSGLQEKPTVHGLDSLRGAQPLESVSEGMTRFLYTAKPSRKERDLGCEALPMRSGGEATDREDDSAGVDNPRAGAGRTGGARNVHPTVKPIALMRWLVRLVTPPGGVVLDPFLGSGTTGIAALEEGFRFAGIEREAEYMTIAHARIQEILK